MKRKKWSELEEQTLLSKYSELLRSGTLSKLKTREKKFKPVAEHVNAAHHLRDPASFPFRWSWRDVSIKVQNMRHQYLGVKQKIRLSPHHFNWKDGPNHWENFLKYKEVFGDVQLLESPKPASSAGAKLGFEIDSDDEDGDEEEADDEEEEEASKARRLGSVVELREAVARREERRREREFRREKGEAERERRRREAELRRERRRERLEEREAELEERQLRWARRELEKRVGLERELEAERRWRKRVEEGGDGVEAEDGRYAG
ncbi:Reticulocyte-binding protein a [Spatholobus suberectus]|nr:Reticulocyte-binding protein a [Spatholobus suberectus]